MKKTQFENLTKYREILMFEVPSTRNKKRYFDLWLCWIFDNRIYCSRVRPVFYDAYKTLMANSISVESVQQMKTMAKAILM